jgi:AraC-like DNA-binding protein
MDVLADRLHRARARGAVFALSTLQAPWGVEMADTTPLSLHAVLRGEVWLTPSAGPDGSVGEPVRLLQGDVALVHSGGTYGLSDDPATPRVPLADVPGRVDGSAVVQDLGGPAAGPTTLLLCGAYRFEGDVCDSLLEALPPVLRVGSGEATGAASLRTALAVLADEIAADSPGQAAVLDRLLDLLLVFTLRAWFAGAEQVPRWYRALDDPQVARALRLLHEDYAARWTVGSLAGAVGLSRAAFARRFTTLVGQTPMGYLTRWRMTVAAELLRDSDRTLAAVAREVGYDNEFAFATAFRRERGVAPGRFRRGAAVPAG